MVNRILHNRDAVLVVMVDGYEIDPTTVEIISFGGEGEHYAVSDATVVHLEAKHKTW